MNFGGGGDIAENTTIPRAQTKNYIKIKVNEKDVACLIDTGAFTNVISLTFLKKIKANMEVLGRNDDQSISTASGQTIKILGKTKLFLQFSVDYDPVEVNFYVLPFLPQNIVLGFSFLAEIGAVLDCENKTINFFDGTLTLPLLDRFAAEPTIFSV